MLIKPPPDLPLPDVSVFVAAAPRSGSSLLCKSMRLTGVLGNPTEYFNVRRRAEEYKLRYLNLEGCCILARTKGSTANGVLASKIFWFHRAALAELIDFDAWFPDQKWVFLRRADVLGQAISAAIANQTLRWSANSAAKRAPIYSRTLIAHKLRQLQGQYRAWENYFSARGVETLDLTYEDIVDNMHATVATMADFVGGNALKDSVLASRPFTEGRFDWQSRKQRTVLNEDWRRQYLAGA